MLFNAFPRRHRRKKTGENVAREADFHKTITELVQQLFSCFYRSCAKIAHPNYRCHSLFSGSDHSKGQIFLPWRFHYRIKFRWHWGMLLRFHEMIWKCLILFWENKRLNVWPLVIPTKMTREYLPFSMNRLISH